MSDPDEPCLGPHTCPGGCGKSVTAREFCCQTDWLRLPPETRILIWKSWDHMPELVAQGVADATRWFRANPRQTPGVVRRKRDRRTGR